MPIHPKDETLYGNTTFVIVSHKLETSEDLLTDRRFWCASYGPWTNRLLAVWQMWNFAKSVEPGLRPVRSRLRFTIVASNQWSANSVSVAGQSSRNRQWFV